MVINSNKAKYDVIENYKTKIYFPNINTIDPLPANTNLYLQIEQPNIDNAKSQIKAATGIANIAVLKNRKPSKISWTYYLSPSISYRNFSKNASNANEILARQVYTVTNPTSNRAITHRPSPGIEAGIAMKYSLSSKIKLTSGFQVNHSAYIIQANNIHPTVSTLLLFNYKTLTPYTISSISYYGNGQGSREADIHNYSLQLSLPVGFEYKIAGDGNMQLYTTATFQPSLVIANKAYLLSTDKRTYMTYASLSRKWNMGTNIGAFISTNSKKLNWQVGPQVNYQILSSYVKPYPVREHFINYGIRFGISKIKK
jgi:hypothetical protein